MQIPSLIFGYDSSMQIGLDKDNDGTVALESVLDIRAQRRATDVFGLSANHLDILSSARLFELVDGYLSVVTSESAVGAAQ